MFPFAFSLFLSIWLLLLYDNLDLMTSFSHMREAGFSYLRDKAFWTYFGSRAFICLIVWLLLTSQEHPLFADDVTMGLAVFLSIIGVIQNFTLRIGKYDLSAFERFSEYRDVIVQNMKDKIDLERARNKQEVCIELERRYPLKELEKHLLTAYALTETPLECAQEDIDDFKQRLGQPGISLEMKKSYYANEIFRVGGDEFAQKLIGNEEARKQ